MELYLVIITTVLVLTQIIRLIQNAIQLHKYEKTDKQNNYTVLAIKAIQEDVREIKRRLK